MSPEFSLSRFAERLASAIVRGIPIADDEFDQWALALHRQQISDNATYREFCRVREGRTGAASVTSWREIPVVSTHGFKELDLTSLASDRRIAAFHSSGTTGHRPSVHHHGAESLALYEQSVLGGLAASLGWPGGPPGSTGGSSAASGWRLLSLTPSAREAPHSSLAHMFTIMARPLPPEAVCFAGRVDPAGAWRIEQLGARTAMAAAVAAERPLLVVGTAFNFVHWLDRLVAAGERWSLPAGSCVLETGGYKGRSRSLPQKELHALISEGLGITPSRIVCEYGMSELSSQAYDTVLAADGPAARRLFQFPSWVRVQVVSPETGREVAEGEVGLLRVFDLANVWSVLAVQTEDLAARRRTGFTLLGRAAAAELRGCSLMSCS